MSGNVKILNECEGLKLMERCNYDIKKIAEENHYFGLVFYRWMPWEIQV